MPLYEYLCQKCGHRLEKIQSFSDKPLKKCPDCGGALEKLISAPTVQFKGSGWYVTDYAKKGSGSASSSASSSSSSESDSGSKDAKESKDAKDSKDTKESTKETKKDDKPKSDGSAKKQK
jgi:putative FmdB family regulatory protein